MGNIPDDNSGRETKKRFSEILSSHLAVEVGEGLQAQGFQNVKPVRGGPGEKAFQGGLGPKKVDVSYADEQHSLFLAVAIENIYRAYYDFCRFEIFLGVCPACPTQSPSIPVLFHPHERRLLPERAGKFRFPHRQ